MLGLSSSTVPAGKRICFVPGRVLLPKSMIRSGMISG